MNGIKDQAFPFFQIMFPLITWKYLFHNVTHKVNCVSGHYLLNLSCLTGHLPIYNRIVMSFNFVKKDEFSVKNPKNLHYTIFFCRP